jgi:photosystem II stability/assembly factor-like uncharacterized protein
MKKIIQTLLIALVFGLLLGACNAQTPTSSPTNTVDTSYPIGGFPSPTDVTYPIESPTEEPTTLPSSTPTTPTPSVGLPIYSLDMFTDGRGWAFNSYQTVLYHTTDGGLSWYTVFPSAGRTLEVGSVDGFFLDGSTAWLSLSDYTTETSSIFHTTDSGATWSETPLTFLGGTLYFLDSNTGFMLSRLGAGAGSEWVALYATTDAGQTWEQRFTHTPGGEEPSLPAGGIKSGFAFLDPLTGWVTGTEPVNDFVYLYRTTDGGVTWAHQPCDITDSDPDAMYNSFPPIFVSETEGFLPLQTFLLDSMPQTILCQTVDGGETWQSTSSAPVQGNIFDFADAQHGWILGDSALFRSTDGATTWEELSVALPAGYTALSLDFVNEQTGWLLVYDSSSDSFEHNLLFYSQNGGQTWTQLDARMGD